MHRGHARTDKGRVSIEEFERLCEDELYRRHVELVRGRVVREPPPMPPHGRAVARVAFLLERYAQEVGGGAVVAEFGVITVEDPPTVRGPDAAYFSRDRIPAGAWERRGFWRIAPDLVVEVLSPSSRAAVIREKVGEYLAAGSRMVWVIDPGARRVEVHRPGGDVRRITVDGELDGADVLPGFRVRAAELFVR